MRIALDARECLNPATGMGRMALELIPRLVAHARHEWVVLVPGGVLLPPALRDARVETLAIAAPAFDPREHIEIPRALTRARIDALHALTYALPLVPGRPCGLTLYDPVPLLHPQGYRYRAHLYWRHILPRTARRARVLVALSHRVADESANLLDLDRQRFAVIPPGVGPPFGPIDAQHTAGTLARLGIEQPYLLGHGNARPHKNRETLMRAHGLLRARRPRLALVLSGGPAPSRRATPPAPSLVSRDQRHHAASNPSGVVDVGRVDDATLTALYAGAAAYVLPSLFEGGGLTPLEAMACGAPCVLSDRGALPELYGQAASIARADPAAMASAIAALLDDTDTAKALRARGHALASRSTWDRTAVALQAALERLSGA